VEFQDVAGIRHAYGPAGIAEPPQPTFFTADTQMTLFTAEGLSRGYLRDCTIAGHPA
jgi:ADP-ribosylglycohydrolase